MGVFENSHYFQGYIAQAYQSLSTHSFDHYIFIADDLILNPSVNQENYGDFFGLGNQGENFIPGFIEFPKVDRRWARSEDALRWRLNRSGIEAADFVPSCAEAQQNFRSLGISSDHVSLAGLWTRWPSWLKKNHQTQTLKSFCEELRRHPWRM